jgi:hypothetical protein
MIHAFKDIRLTSSFINATGGVLKVNNETVVYASQTGALLNYSGILSDRLYQTGASLLSLIAANSAGVTSISVTGHAVQSGSINFTGAGNVVVQTGINNTIIFSGDTSALATIVNLGSTGSTLYNNIVGLSGVLNADILNLGTTGSNLYNLINNFSGVFNNSGSQYQTQINTLTTNLASTGISLKNSLNLDSGNLITTGQTLYTYLNIFSGNSQSFSTGMTTGFDNYRVDFPLLFLRGVPRVFPSVEISGSTMYAVNITGRTTGNFYALFSDIIAESGVVLHIYATVNS